MGSPAELHAGLRSALRVQPVLHVHQQQPRLLLRRQAEGSLGHVTPSSQPCSTRRAGNV